MLIRVNPGLSVEDLEAAVAVYEHGHFTRASEVLNRSQPSITRGVHNVEASVDAKLFNRGTRPVSPTPAGEELSYEVRKGLYFLKRGLSKARRIGHLEESTLQVGYSSYFDLNLLSYLANVAKSQTAGFKAIYHSSWSPAIVANILAGVWDCGFVLNPAETYDLERIPVLHDPLGIVMARDHPLSQKRVIRLADLRNEPLILPTRDRNPVFRAWFMGHCGSAGLIPDIVQEIGHPHEGIVLAAQHIGIAVVTRSTGTESMHTRATVFRPMMEDFLAIEVELVVRRDSKAPAMVAFINAVSRMRERIQHEAERKGPSSVTAPKPKAIHAL
jgi:DNA-binding transcriptional LysR family regulator